MPVQLPGETVRRGTRLAVYLSNLWKEMDYNEKRPWMEETAREKRLYEDALANGGVLSVVVDPNTSRAQQFGDAQRFQLQQDQQPLVVSVAPDGETAAFTANVPLAKPSTGAGAAYSRPSETSQWASALATPARPFNFSERLNAARLVAAWAEKEAEVVGEQGHQLVNQMQFSQHKLSEARAFRNQIWMGEVFERNVGELEHLQHSNVADTAGGRKQMVQQIEMVLDEEIAQRDFAAKQLAAAVSDSAVGAARRSVAIDLVPSKRLKLGNPAGSTSGATAAGKDGEASSLLFVEDASPNDPIMWSDQGNRVLL